MEERGRRQIYEIYGLYEQIPPDIIDAIIINPEFQELAQDPTHPLYQYLQKDFLIQQAVFGLGRSPSPSESVDTVERLNAPTSLRGITVVRIEDNPIFIGDVAYTELDAKGSLGFTPFKLQERTHETQHRRGFQRFFAFGAGKEEEPDFMFGGKGARSDTQISNSFAAYHARTARNLGIVLINNSKFGEWAYKKQQEVSSPYAYDLRKMLSIVAEKNRDTLSIIVRLTNPSYDNIRYNLQEGPYTYLAMVSNSSNAYLKEIEKAGSEDAYRERYGMQIPFHLIPSLERITERRLFYKDDLSVYLMLEAHLNGYNYGRLHRLSMEKYGGLLTIKDPIHAAQDFTFGGVWKDYEETLPNPLPEDLPHSAGTWIHPQSIQRRKLSYEDEQWKLKELDQTIELWNANVLYSLCQPLEIDYGYYEKYTFEGLDAGLAA